MHKNINFFLVYNFGSQEIHASFPHPEKVPRVSFVDRALYIKLFVRFFCFFLTHYVLNKNSKRIFGIFSSKTSCTADREVLIVVVIFMPVHCYCVV